MLNQTHKTMIRNSSILAVSCVTALLFSACTKSPEDIIEELVEVESDVDRRSSLSHFKNIFSSVETGGLTQEDLNSGLRYSIEFNYPEFALFFIEKGADINGSVFYANGDVKFDTTMLGFASRLNKIEFVRMLIEKGASVDFVLFPGDQTPLMQLASLEATASASSYEEVFKYLLEKGANVAVQDKNGKKLLFLLLENRNFNLAKLALAHGAKIETRTPDGGSLIVYASERDDKEMIDFLLDGGADINEICKNTNPLFSVLQRGDGTEFAEYLVTKGANVDCGNMLMTFLESNRIDAVKFLLAHGANVNLKPDKGTKKSAWETVLTSKNLDLISLFLEYKADPNLILSNGQTALDFLIDQGLYGAAKALINAGADTSNFVRIEVCDIPMEDFCMGKFEITQKQYKSIMGKMPQGIKKYSDDLPVYEISLDEANMFCEKLTAVAHLLDWIPQDYIYALPSDYQWSCAFGINNEQYASVPRYVNEHPLRNRPGAWTKDSSGNRVHAVGGTREGLYGLHDMLGNVWEWTSEGNARGGSFSSDYAAPRERKRVRGEKFNDLGFRVALVPKITRAIRGKDKREFLSMSGELSRPDMIVDGESLLIHAIRSVDWHDGQDIGLSVKILQKLIEKGADPNAKNNWGLPAIVFATGPSIKSLSGGERSPHGCALEFAQALLDAGVNVNDAFQGITPLTLAVNLNDYELAEFLLKKGADKKFMPKTNSSEDTRRIAPFPWDNIRVFSTRKGRGMRLVVDDGFGGIYKGTSCFISEDEIHKLTFDDKGMGRSDTGVAALMPHKDRDVYYLFVWKDWESYDKTPFSLEREYFLGRVPMDTYAVNGYGASHKIAFGLKKQLGSFIIKGANARRKKTLPLFFEKGIRITRCPYSSPESMVAHLKGFTVSYPYDGGRRWCENRESEHPFVVLKRSERVRDF